MPFDPADPSQWWWTHSLPRTFAQPNAWANVASANPAGADGIDDWFVPAQAPRPTGFPNDWSMPGSVQADGYPDDWIYPNNQNTPAPPAAPRPAPPAASPQPAAADPAISARPAPADPFAALWSLIPASAWVTPLPIFPDALGRYPMPAPAPSALPPSIAGRGLFGDLPEMLAASASTGSPSGGLFGGILTPAAASAAPNSAQGLLSDIPKLIAASETANLPPGGLLGGIAKLQLQGAEASISPFGVLRGAADQSPPAVQKFADLGWRSTPTGSGIASNYPEFRGLEANQQLLPEVAHDLSNRSDAIERTSARGPSGPTSFGNSSAESDSIQTAQAEVPGSPAMIGPTLRAAVAAGRLTEEEAAIL
jgi:hypothetical protein